MGGGFEFNMVQLAIGGGALAVVVIGLLMLLRRPAKKVDQHTERVQCACGWSGVVSRYNGKCPQCNAAIGTRVGDQA